jgi:hypothetical protein
MVIAFLFLAPLASFAAGSVTLTTDKTAYAGTVPIKVSGTVTPAPATSGTYIAISIASPSGQQVDANEFAVATGTGAYNGTFTTGGSSYSVNGTYTITANYQGATATSSFQYGSTTGSTVNGSATTIITTIDSITTEVTTVSQGGLTTTVVNNLPGTTVTSIVTSATTVVSQITSTASDSTALAIGAVGLIIAIVAIVLAVLTMRKK